MQAEARLTTGVSLIVVGQAISAAAVFALGVVTARALGPAGRGVFSTATFAAVLAGSASLSVVPAVAFFRPQGMFKVAAGGAVLGLSAGGLASLYLSTLPAVPSPAAFAPLIYSLAVVPVAVATGEALAAAAVGRLAVLYAAGPLAQVCAVLGAVALGEKDPGALVVVWVSGFLVVAATISSITRWSGGTARFTALLAYTGVAAGANILWALGARIELFVLAAVDAPFEVGVYAVALAPAQAAVVLAAAYTSANYRRFSAEAPPSRAQVRNIVWGLIRLQAGLLLVAAASVPLVLTAVYGAAFDKSIAPALVLLTAAAVIAPVQPLTAYFNNTLGRPTLTAVVAASAATTTLAVALAAVPAGGSLGAAGASLGGSVVCLATACWLYCRRPASAPGQQSREQQTKAGDEPAARPSPESSDEILA